MKNFFIYLLVFLTFLYTNSYADIDSCLVCSSDFSSSEPTETFSSYVVSGNYNGDIENCSQLPIEVFPDHNQYTITYSLTTRTSWYEGVAQTLYEVTTSSIVCSDCTLPDEPLPDYNTTLYSIHSTFDSCDQDPDPSFDSFISECSEFDDNIILSERIDCCSKTYCLIPNDHPCPEHSTYSDFLGKCICNSPYIGYDINNSLVCRLPDCPPFYDDHTPPLPLFKQTDNVSNCSFFEFSDSAILEYEDIVCCYGQEGLDNNDTCGINELEVNGECYPITPSEIPKDDNRTCSSGEYYSFIEGHCVPFYDNNDTGDTGTGDTGTGDTGTGDTGTGDNVYNEDDALGSVNDALNFDRIQSVVEGAFDSYVLLPLPVTVSGTCSSEFRRTFDVFGHTYVLDLNDYMSSLYDLLPILKAIILFISVYSAIVLVLAGKGD